MQITERKHISKVLALVRMSCAGGWYGVACGNTMLQCHRCRRHRKALCSPRPHISLLCADCFPLVERELDLTQKAAIAVEMLPLLEQEAAKRRAVAGREQAAHGKKGGRGNQKPPTQKVGEGVSHEGEAAAVAASTTGTNRQYVAEARAQELAR